MPATQPPKTEIVIVNRCIDLLNTYQQGHARKVHGSRFAQAGEPDIDACIRGRAVKVEVKMPGHTPTAIQYASLRRWEAAGALVGWVHSTEMLRELLTHVDDRDWRNPQVCKHRHRVDAHTLDAVEPVMSMCEHCGTMLDQAPTRRV